MTTPEKIKKLVDADPMIMSIFVQTALLEYSDKVLDNQEQVKQDLSKAFINGDAWIEAAKEVKSVFEK